MGDQGLGKILIYQNENGDTRIDVYFGGDTIWMSQKSLAELYQVRIPTINEHIKNILSDGELNESTIREFLIVQNEGAREIERQVKHYNFQMVLAIGYRVRSHVGIHFRNWASKVLTEYSKKGFVMNDERLKNPQLFGTDYFDELLERIRDIRASEKRFYEKIKEIYAKAKAALVRLKFEPRLLLNLGFAFLRKGAVHFLHEQHLSDYLLLMVGKLSNGR